MPIQPVLAHPQDGRSLSHGEESVRPIVAAEISDEPRSNRRLQRREL
jgi:hypothetical protein